METNSKLSTEFLLGRSKSNGPHCNASYTTRMSFLEIDEARRAATQLERVWPLRKSMCTSRAEQKRGGERKAAQSRAGQSRAEETRREQSRAQQSRAEQGRAEQSRAEQTCASLRFRLQESARTMVRSTFRFSSTQVTVGQNFNGGGVDVRV